MQASEFFEFNLRQHKAKIIAESGLFGVRDQSDSTLLSSLYAGNWMIMKKLFLYDFEGVLEDLLSELDLTLIQPSIHTNIIIHLHCFQCSIKRIAERGT